MRARDSGRNVASRSGDLRRVLALTIATGLIGFADGLLLRRAQLAKPRW